MNTPYTLFHIFYSLSETIDEFFTGITKLLFIGFFRKRSTKLNKDQFIASINCINFQLMNDFQAPPQI